MNCWWIRHMAGTSCIVVLFLTGCCCRMSAINFFLYLDHLRFIKYSSNTRWRDGMAQSKYIFILQGKKQKDKYSGQSSAKNVAYFCQMLPKFCSPWNSQYRGISKHSTLVFAKMTRSSICSPRPNTQPTLYCPISTKRTLDFSSSIGSLLDGLEIGLR